MHQELYTHLFPAAYCKLCLYREVWKNKGILRKIYGRYYEKVRDLLPSPCKRVVEVGGGTGNLKSSIPSVISTDIVFCEWLDAVLDAVCMPFQSASLDAIVLIDVLHHLADPIRFFREVERCLKSKGRLILVDVAVTPFSGPVLKLFHPEPAHFKVDFFQPSEPGLIQEPWDSNQAMVTALFWKHRDRFEKLFPGLRIMQARRIEWLWWPLSGGFSRRSLIPVSFVDKFPSWTNWRWFCRIAAFRTLVCLEKV